MGRYHIVTGSRNSKDRQWNGLKKKDKTNNVRYNITQKTKDGALRTGLKNFLFSGRVSSYCFTSGICRFTLATNPVKRHK